ncbi:unnamed protein product [Sphenostylis stenocarpa]|uniref:Uncharacterized protein n=1 Tax=Sphenostylis stenocarpa TaxID=92480 RepID=A0AA86RT60_9FABA|nr:unnamed protein product [Sphenostylis stenocarpa]
MDTLKGGSLGTWKQKTWWKNMRILAGLDELRILNLSHNFFTGSLPDNLFHLQNLEVMDFSNNHLQGSINTVVCSTFTQLRIFKLSHNSFSGKVPGNLGKCSSLQHLSIDGNDLSGTLPESIFQVQNLSVLHLQANKLFGPLSKGLGKLSNLVEFDISNNGFSGTLPNVFGSLTRLQIFYADSNRFSGQLPASLENSASLEMLILRNNSLGGSINFNCSAMKKLTTINLGYTKFSCPTPGSLSNCLRLEAINHAGLHFNCRISVNFKNHQSLTQLLLSNANMHNLPATLEDLSHCRNLSTLVLANNFHNEEMRQLNGQNPEFSNLKVFVLANSQITGSIPKWLSACKMLQMLDLSMNHLTGSIPSWIGKFNSLYYLDLSNNSFTGNIPQSFTMFMNLQQKNSSLEATLSAFPLYLLGTGASKRLKYEKLSNLRPSLLLSYNKLEGPIWAGMKMLEILDLSHNKLSGEIPESLTGLSFLSSFDVSHNELHGEIPTKGQFNTFPTTSFEGNKGLYYGHTTSGGSVPSPPDETGAQPNHQKLHIIGFPFWFGALAGFLIIIAICFASGWIFS